MRKSNWWPPLRTLCVAIWAAVAGLALFGSLPSRAETYPAKPVRIVVPFAAGGAADLIARGLGQALTERWKQQVVIENKPGANTQIAAEHVARAAPDGHTLFVSSEGTFVMNPSLYSKLPYDPDADFVPITGLVALNQVLVTSPKLPASNIRQLIALAKAKPGALTYGTTGNGSASHLNMAMLQNMAGIDLVTVHYRGAAQAITDLMAGHIHMIFLSVGLVWEHTQAGKLRIVGVGSKQRLSKLPQIPTIGESGLPGFEGSSWFGLFAPAGVSPELITKINADVKAIFDAPGFRDKFLEPNYLDPIVTSPQSFAMSIKTGQAKWGKIIRDANLKVN